MHKLLVMMLGLLILSGLLQAQSKSPLTDATPAPGNGLTAIQGCLSEPLGEYMLTESDGTEHTLSGGARQLKHYVGHRIEVTGKPGIMTVDTSIAGAGSSAIEQRVFGVKSVKDIASSCQPK